MTYEGAIETIKVAIAEVEWNYPMDYAVAFEIAISALEKQIPKVSEHEDGVWNICPCCGGSVCNDTEHAVNREVSYCEHCGQAIDWENSEFD